MMSGFFMASAGQQLAKMRNEETSGVRAARVAAEARIANTALQSDVEKLFMITEALWEILKYQHGYTDDQLVDMIQEIDMRSGKLDGKTARATTRPACPQCKRTAIQRQPTCLYCGAMIPTKPFER